MYRHGYRVRFLDGPGKTRNATDADAQYLEALEALVHDAAHGDPGEGSQEETFRTYMRK